MTDPIKTEDLGARAKELTGALSGSVMDKMEDDRTILLKMEYGKRPEVTFTGFWSGRFLQGALSSISKAYRLRRHKNVRPFPNTGVGQGEPANGGGEKKE